MAKRKTEMLSTTYITENTFDSLKMINSWSLKKLTNCVYSIGQIRASDSQVLQCPYQRTIVCRIRVSITRTHKMRTGSQRRGNMTGLKHHSTGKKIMSIFGLSQEQAIISISDLKTKKVAKLTQIFDSKLSNKTSNKLSQKRGITASKNDVIHIY